MTWSLFESGPALTEDGSLVWHQVAFVFFADAGVRTAAVLNVGTANLAGASAHPVTRQLDASLQPVVRPVNGVIDLGAVER